MPKRRNKLPTRGKRSGVTIGDEGEKNGNQMESIDNFYDQARSPEEKKDDDPSTKQSSDYATAAGATSRVNVRNRKASVRKAQEKVRLSLPGQAGEGDDASTSTDTSDGDRKHKYSSKKSAPRKIMGVPSPSEISRVSTLPPTPKTDIKHRLLSPEAPAAPTEKPQSAVENLEVPRHAAPPGVTQEQPAPAEELNTTEFNLHQGDDEDDEGDDLAPPVMDDSMDQEEPVTAATMPTGGEEDTKPAAKTPLPDNGLSDTDDDDKEGAGFDMVQNSETPDTERETRAPAEEDDHQEEDPARAKKKKSTKRRSSIDSEDKTPVQITKKKKKKNRRVVFSPQGVPVANRDYHKIPVVEPSPDDYGGVRRSKRAKTAPLAFWKNERVEYGPPDDHLVDEIGDMPIPKHVVKALPTPYRKRKDPSKAKAVSKNGKSKPKKRSVSHRTEEEEEDAVDSFDPAFLRRKYKDNLLEGETANIWDDGNDDLNDLKVVSYSEKMEAAELPLSNTRTEEEGNVVGSAAQAFNVPSDANDNYVGYIMGNLLLPPRGIKDAESVGPCSQTFTVCTGQKKTLEVAFSDPDGPEGMLEDESAQRFLLGPGDLFRVPPGNTYRLENHSMTKPCLMSWTIIRPRNPPATPAATTPSVTAEHESP